MPVLLDIDGTFLLKLLLRDGVGMAWVREAFAQILRREADPSTASFPGSLDPSIFGQAHGPETLGELPPETPGARLIRAMLPSLQPPACAPARKMMAA